MAGRDCPMCGDTMRLRERHAVDRLPGHAQTATIKSHEWVCGECDYFEEAEEEG